MVRFILTFRLVQDLETEGKVGSSVTINCMTGTVLSVYLMNYILF